MFFKVGVIISVIFLASFITEGQISVMFFPCVKSEDNLSAIFLTSTKKILNSKT